MFSGVLLGHLWRTIFLRQSQRGREMPTDIIDGTLLVRSCDSSGICGWGSPDVWSSPRQHFSSILRDVQLSLVNINCLRNDTKRHTQILSEVIVILHYLRTRTVPRYRVEKKISVKAVSVNSRLDSGRLVGQCSCSCK